MRTQNSVIYDCTWLPMNVDVNETQSKDTLLTRSPWRAVLKPDKQGRDGKTAESIVRDVLKSAGAETEEQVALPDPLRTSRKMHHVDVAGYFNITTDAGQSATEYVLVSVRTSTKGSNWAHGTLWQEVDRLSELLAEGYCDRAGLILAGNAWEDDQIVPLMKKAMKLGVHLYSLDKLLTIVSRNTEGNLLDSILPKVGIKQVHLSN